MNEWDLVSQAPFYQEMFGEYWAHALVIISVIQRVFPSTQNPDKMNVIHKILHYIFEKTNDK